MGKGSPVPFLGILENHTGLESPNVSSWPKILEHPGPTNLKWDVVTPWDPENSSSPKGHPSKKHLQF